MSTFQVQSLDYVTVCIFTETPRDLNGIEIAFGFCAVMYYPYKALTDSVGRIKYIFNSPLRRGVGVYLLYK
jgi:hypothetical protein